MRDRDWFERKGPFERRLRLCELAERLCCPSARVVRLEAVWEELDSAVTDFERFPLEAGGDQLKCGRLHRLELAGLELEQDARMLERLVAPAAFDERLGEAAREGVVRSELDRSACTFDGRGAVPELIVRGGEERPALLALRFSCKPGGRKRDRARPVSVVMGFFRRDQVVVVEDRCALAKIDD